jgi:hypothetical protein
MGIGKQNYRILEMELEDKRTSNQTLTSIRRVRCSERERQYCGVEYNYIFCGNQSNFFKPQQKDSKVNLLLLVIRKTRHSASS